MRKPLGALTRNVAIYGAGDVAITAVGFLLLPIYLEYLQQEGYGALGLLIGVEAISKIFFRWGLDGAFMRYYHDCETPAERMRLTSTVCLFLLLASGKLLQPLQGFVHLVVDGLLLTPLNGLVLVSKFVELELEEIGQIFGGSRLSATAAATAIETDLDVSENGIGTLQVLKRTLLGRKSRIGILGRQLFLRRPHLLDGLSQRFANRGEVTVHLSDASIVHPPEEVLDLLPEPSLHQRHRGNVFIPVALLVLFSVAD